MLEKVEYDKLTGQLNSASYPDYQIPLAQDVPEYHVFRTETPTNVNPLGIKGIGEAGTIASTPAIANAVADALSVLGVRISDMPLPPAYLREFVKEGQARQKETDTESDIAT